MSLMTYENNKTAGFEVIEQVIVSGDLSKLNPEQRVTYYHKVCESLGLNPYTRPFDYITLQGKLTFYAKKDATEQLRKVHGISITGLEGKLVDDLYIVTATAKTHDGRIDQATGAVNLGALKGDAKANAIMKAETKAKRRVTLSIGGLGWADESEIETIPEARPAKVDFETGEILQVQTSPVDTKKLQHKSDTKLSQNIEYVTKDQAEELKETHDLCDPAYKEQIFRNLKESGILGWSKVPKEKFSTMLEAASKNAVEFQMKTKEEIENENN